jgi:hypothetical protein
MVYEYEANINHHSIFVSVSLGIRKFMVYEYEANKNHHYVYVFVSLICFVSVSLIFYVSLGKKSITYYHRALVTN